MKTGLHISFVALIVLVQGCNVTFFEDPEFNEVVFDPSVAVPLGTATYDIQSLFEQVEPGATFSNADGEVVTLVYEQNLSSDSSNEFLNLPDQQFEERLASGSVVSNPTNPTEVEVTQSFAFDYLTANKANYDSILATSGQLSIELISDLNATSDFELILTSVLEDDQPMRFTGVLNAQNNRFQLNESLEQKSIHLNKDENGNAVRNTFLVHLTYRTTVQPGESISNTEGIDLNIRINDQVFAQIFGEFGQESLKSNTQKIDIAFFNRFESGSITFAQPSLRFTYDNAFGFPLSADYSQIKVNESTGATTFLSGAATTQENLIAGPEVSMIGNSLNTEFVIDNSNSNIVTLLGLQPESIEFGIDFLTNPNSAASQYNFAEEQSLLSAKAVFEIPFEFNMQDLRAFEELGFNNVDLSQATGLLLRASSENELPLGGDVELQFLDANGIVVFVVDERPAFTAAELLSDGSTNGSSSSVTDILLDAEDIKNIEKANKVRLVVRLNTTDADSNQPVKFFNDDLLIFRLAAQVDLQLSSKGN